MRLSRKFAIYAVSAIVLLAFTPALAFRDLAAAWVILVGLFLIDVVQTIRRR